MSSMLISIDVVLTRLRTEGYYVTRVPVGGGEAEPLLLEIARALGELFVPQGCKPATPIIRTAPTHARRAAPFDRPEPIGWHGDFATYENRPELSLVYITRPDPRGGHFGAWRLASVDRVIEALRSTESGRAALNLLARERLPFSYAEGEHPRWFTAVQEGSGGRIGLRFYLPSIRRGCVSTYGEVPPHLLEALAAVERAADMVGEVVPTRAGSLLVASNWFALHDRTEQTVRGDQPNREALLCFVSHTHEGVPSMRDPVG